jgi:hypothetical protein
VNDEQRNFLLYLCAQFIVDTRRMQARGPALDDLLKGYEDIAMAASCMVAINKLEET